MSWRAAALSALLILPLGAPTPAEAHESDPGVVAVIDAIDPPLPQGVNVQVATSVVTQLVVANPTREPLEALDDEDRPFLQVSSAGVVADVASRQWRASNVPSGRVPAAASPARAGRMVPISSSASWGWFDHRVHPGRAFVPERVRALRIRVELARWQVPLRYAGRPVSVRGHLEYRPVLGRLVAAVTSAPLPAGMTVTAVDGRVPALFLRNDTTEPAVVMDTGDGRFASIGRDGVLVMDRSEVHLEDQRIKGRDLSFEPRTGEGLRVSAAPSYTWFDPRIRVSDEAVPDIVQKQAAPAVLSRWTVPVVVAGTSFDVTGTTSWVPLSDEQRASSAVEDDPYRLGGLLLVAAPGLALLAFVLVRRRATYHRRDGEG